MKLWLLQKLQLEFRRYDILKDNGRIFKTQPIESDFDRAVKEISLKEGWC